MEQYISKSALVAEIEKRQNVLDLDSPLGRGGMTELQVLKDKLNTLEMKEVDINKEISQFIDANFEKAKIGHKLSLRRTAKHFFELGLKAQKGE